MRALRSMPFGVFVILLGSYAFFWHARDWNSASRLMLTYALVDRGSVAIDGLSEQTRDIAHFQGHYYTDKLPGLSLLAVPPYALAKLAFVLPDHPLFRPGFRYWPADYAVTLATSGLLSAAAGALLTSLAAGLGCGPRRSALVGLSYGLATPAYVYATLAFGHQAAAFCLLASFTILWRGPISPRRAMARAGLAGFLAAWAAVIELQVGPVSAILGGYLLARVIARQWPVGAVGAFAVGALVPTLVLLGYNQLAFGSPWQLGYFHERLRIFSRVHSKDNPLGLGGPRWSLAVPLLWGGYRGLLFYAPILFLAVPGWIALFVRRLWGIAAVSALACLAVFLVNLSYPEWTGGWSTGPRLLVPILPFAMLPIAGLLAVGGRSVTSLTVSLTLVGAALMLLFQGVGGRIPDKARVPGSSVNTPILDPLGAIVWPAWRGDPRPEGSDAERFDRNLISWLCPGLIRGLPESALWVQFLPLVAFQLAGIVLLFLPRPAKGGIGCEDATR